MSVHLKIPKQLNGNPILQIATIACGAVAEKGIENAPIAELIQRLDELFRDQAKVSAGAQEERHVELLQRAGHRLLKRTPGRCQSIVNVEDHGTPENRRRMVVGLR